MVLMDSRLFGNYFWHLLHETRTKNFIQHIETMCTHTHIRTHTENHKNTKSETTVYKQKTGNIFSTQTQQYDVKIFKKYR